ncbi:ROOT HAIR DEFECTIVE 3-like protein [Drosera capensis]
MTASCETLFTAGKLFVAGTLFVAGILFTSRNSVRCRNTIHPEHYSPAVAFTLELTDWCPYPQFHPNLAQVANLKLRLSEIIAPGGLIGRGAFVPGSGFSLAAQNFWTEIQANRNLNLPREEVMVAHAICKKIAEKIFHKFIEDEEWCKLSADAKSCAIPGFGRKLKLLFERCLLRYDEESKYFDERGRSRKKESLTQKLFKHVEATVSSLLQNLHYEFRAKFKEEFDKAVNEERCPSDADNCTRHWIKSFDDRCADVMMKGATWDITASKRNFRAEVKAHIKSKLKAKLREALAEPVKAALRIADENTWPSIRTCFRREIAFASSMSVLHVEDIRMIKSHARSLIVSIASKEAEEIFLRMEQRFQKEFMTVFQRGGWEGIEGIKCIAIQARVMSMKLLEAMVAVRLEDYGDNVGNILSASCLVADGNTSGIPDSSTWIGIPDSVTIITPSQCCSLLRTFWLVSKELVDSILVKYNANKEEHKDHKIAAMVTIGFVASLGIVSITTVAIVGGPVTLVGFAVTSLLSSLANYIMRK